MKNISKVLKIQRKILDLDWNVKTPNNMGAFVTAQRTLLHELHRRPAPKNTWSLWSTSLCALTSPLFFLEQSYMELDLFG
jgi:hypothetical protein